MCEACDLRSNSCQCVPCRACGHDTPPEDMWQGKCGACEDEQMVRGIM